jgi:flagellar assembly protein FliH
MPVLKQTHNTPAMREAIVLDLGDIGAQAARIRAAAEAQASKIIADAQRKSESLADQLHDEAQKQGYADGLEKGLAEGREQGRAEALAESSEQLQQLMAAWSQVATDWEQQRTDMEREARQAVLDFALSAAEKIVHRVIEIDESVVVDQAAQALSLVLSAHDATVSVHPVDRPMLEDAMPQLVKELATLEHIELVDDEAITPGGCVVSFGQGRIDATIEKQLERLINLMLPEPPRIEPEDPMPAAPEPTSTATADAEAGEQAAADRTSGAFAEVDLQGVADAAAEEVAGATIEPTAKPPVYEITEDGLVQTQGDDVGQVPPTLNDAHADEPTPPADPPPSEA